METLKIEKQEVLMIAHRGLSGLETENTVEAFVAAANRSYYGIECDIHKTKDGKFVVIHDSDTLRVSGVRKVIAESNYDELLSVSLYDYIHKNSRPYRKIPLLSDYLTICSKYKKKAIIEIKPEFSITDLERLVTEVRNFDYLHNTIFISFNINNLINLRKISKTFELQYLVSEYSDAVLNDCRKHFFDININFLNLSHEQVKKFHNYDIKVNVHTVDNPIVALMLVTWDVDFITSNILE